AAASAFLENGREVVGFFHGYSNLQEYDREKHPLLADKHYRVFTERDLRGLRNSRGIIIGTARANPGKGIGAPKDLEDPEKTAGLRRVHQAPRAPEVDERISTRGQDTPNAANSMVGR